MRETLEWIMLGAGALAAVAAALAVIARLWKWAYAETKRRHALDRVARMEAALQKVVAELSPNGGESMWDRLHRVDKETLPEIIERVCKVETRVQPVEAYVDELKGREARARVRTHREPPPAPIAPEQPPQPPRR